MRTISQTRTPTTPAEGINDVQSGKASGTSSPPRYYGLTATGGQSGGLIVDDELHPSIVDHPAQSVGGAGVGGLPDLRQIFGAGA